MNRGDPMTARPRGLALLVAALLALLALAPAGAGAEVLYDQTAGAAAGAVPSILANYSGEVAPGATCDGNFTDANCFAADDFTVPPGPPWVVSNLHVVGQGGAGDSLSWQVAEAAGPPAPQTSTDGLALPFASPVGGGGAGYGGTTTATADGFDSSAPGPLLLSPGHYWLSAYVSTVGSKSIAPWSWQTLSSVSGSPALWLSSQCTNPPEYLVLSRCGIPGSDLSFRLEGGQLTSHYSDFQVGKKERTPDGGLNVFVVFPGPFAPGSPKLKKVSGPGKVTFLRTIAPKLEPDGTVPAVIRIRPAGKTAAALKEGKRFKIGVQVSFTRYLPPTNGISVPPSTRTLRMVLKKTR
jgi:hypothetical protein